MHLGTMSKSDSLTPFMCKSPTLHFCHSETTILLVPAKTIVSQDAGSLKLSNASRDVCAAVSNNSYMYICRNI